MARPHARESGSIACMKLGSDPVWRGHMARRILDTRNNFVRKVNICDNTSVLIDVTSGATPFVHRKFCAARARGRELGPRPHLDVVDLAGHNVVPPPFVAAIPSKAYKGMNCVSLTNTRIRTCHHSKTNSLNRNSSLSGISSNRLINRRS